jgi:hypothetical protein
MFKVYRIEGPSKSPRRGDLTLLDKNISFILELMPDTK